jgi:ankyrin repeat protein
MLEHIKAFAYKTKHGITPSEAFINCTTIEETERFVKDYGVDINYQAEANGNTLLIASVINNNQALLSWCLKNGAKRDIQAANGMPALMYACEKGNFKDVYALISYGANLNLTDSKGYTAIEHAALNGQLQVINLLLSNNAKVLGSNILAFKSTFIEESDNTNYVPQVKGFVAMLLGVSNKTIKKEVNATLFDYLYQTKNYITLKNLLLKGANIDAPLENGSTFLGKLVYNIAKTHKQNKAISPEEKDKLKFLLENGASPLAELNEFTNTKEFEEISDKIANGKKIFTRLDIKDYKTILYFSYNCLPNEIKNLILVAAPSLESLKYIIKEALVPNFKAFPLTAMELRRIDFVNSFNSFFTDDPKALEVLSGSLKKIFGVGIKEQEIKGLPEPDDVRVLVKYLNTEHSKHTDKYIVFCKAVHSLMSYPNNIFKQISNRNLLQTLVKNYNDYAPTAILFKAGFSFKEIEVFADRGDAALNLLQLSKLALVGKWTADNNPFDDKERIGKFSSFPNEIITKILPYVGIKIYLPKIKNTVKNEKGEERTYYSFIDHSCQLDVKDKAIILHECNTYNVLRAFQRTLKENSLGDLKLTLVDQLKEYEAHNINKDHGISWLQRISVRDNEILKGNEVTL